MRFVQSKKQAPLSILDVMSPCKSALQQRSCSKLCQAAVPSRVWLKYRAGVPAMEMDTTSFNLIGLWPYWAVFHDVSANRTCPGPRTISCFNFSNMTNNKREKWANCTQKGLNQCPPNSCSSQKTDVPTGLIGAVWWTRVRQPGPWGQPQGPHSNGVYEQTQGR